LPAESPAEPSGGAAFRIVYDSIATLTVLKTLSTTIDYPAFALAWADVFSLHSAVLFSPEARQSKFWSLAAHKSANGLQPKASSVHAGAGRTRSISLLPSGVKNLFH